MSETTITIDADTKARLDEYRPEGQSWDGFLNYLVDELDAYAEAMEETTDATALGMRAIHGGVTEDDVRTLIDGLRSDLLAEVPREVADELDRRRR